MFCTPPASSLPTMSRFLPSVVAANGSRGGPQVSGGRKASPRRYDSSESDFRLRALSLKVSERDLNRAERFSECLADAEQVSPWRAEMLLNPISESESSPSSCRINQHSLQKLAAVESGNLEFLKEESQLSTTEKKFLQVLKRSFDFNRPMPQVSPLRFRASQMVSANLVESLDIMRKSFCIAVEGDSSLEQNPFFSSFADTFVVINNHLRAVMEKFHIASVAKEQSKLKKVLAHHKLHVRIAKPSEISVSTVDAKETSLYGSKAFKQTWSRPHQQKSHIQRSQSVKPSFFQPSQRPRRVDAFPRNFAPRGGRGGGVRSRNFQRRVVRQTTTKVKAERN